MQQVTPSVYTETTVRGCNPSYVNTGDGVVVIDTPQLPTRAVAMRKEAESHGPIRYLINTEHHVDHIFGNYYFKGAGLVVNHQGVYDNFMTVYPELDPSRTLPKPCPPTTPTARSCSPTGRSTTPTPTKGASSSPATRSSPNARPG